MKQIESCVDCQATSTLNQHIQSSYAQCLHENLHHHPPPKKKEENKEEKLIKPVTAPERKELAH